MNEPNEPVYQAAERTPGLWRMWGRCFCGPLAWIAVLACVWGVVALGAIVAAIIWLACAETLAGMIAAGALLGGGLALMLLVKIFGWMLILHHATTDRLDRIEKRLSGISGPGAT